MRLTILGPIQAWSDGRPIDLGRRGHRLVLGVLSLEVNKFVSADRLIDLLWGASPPFTAKAVLHSRISILRRKLREAGVMPRAVRLESQPNGYIFHAEPDLVDAHQFTSLAAQAQTAPHDEERVELLRAALELWRGPVLEGQFVSGGIGGALESARLNVLEHLYDAELRLGNHSTIIDSILQAIAENPGREGFVEQCILALYRGGRVTEALATYESYRRRLADDLGVDPGSGLQLLHRQILANDGSLQFSATSPVVGRPMSVPAQLPADIARFTGRHEQVKILDQTLDRPTVSDSGRVMVIVGPPGSGKTALALNWSHRNREEFPDGQLFVDLRGYGGDEPLMSEIVLERFLRSLGASADGQPADPDERAAAFRSELARRRMLVVLDNASSAAQIRPLLPGAGACLTIVTSRNRLDGLVATHGVTRIELGALDLPEALALVTDSRRLVNPVLASRLVKLCGGLPLALRIASARLMSPEQDIHELLSELADQRHRLQGLAVDEEISVRSALDGSTRVLTPSLRRTFRLLGLHPGPRLSAAACASMQGVDRLLARDRLMELAQVSLIKAEPDDVYVLHDLVKLYADELSKDEDPADDRAQALRRVLTWYRDTANAADRLLRPTERPNFPATGEASFDDEVSAMDWLERESASLIAAATQAGETHPDLAWQIAAAMHGWLMRCGQRNQWVELYERAAEWARRAEDLNGQAIITGRLAIPLSMLGRSDEAAKACKAAHRIRTQIGDRLGAATALVNLGGVYVNANRPDDAVSALQQARTLARDLPDSGHLLTIAAINIAEAYRLAHQPARSVEAYLEGLAAGEGSLADRDLAQIMIGMGGARNDSGNAIGAIDDCQRGYDLAVKAGDRVLAAEAQAELGRIFVARNDYKAALQHIESALLVLEELGHRNVAELRTLRSQVADHNSATPSGMWD